MSPFVTAHPMERCAHSTSTAGTRSILPARFVSHSPGAQAVIELDARTGELLNKYATGQQGSWFVEVTPDERKLYTPNLEGQSVSVIAG